MVTLTLGFGRNHEAYLRCGLERRLWQLNESTSSKQGTSVETKSSHSVSAADTDDNVKFRVDLRDRSAAVSPHLKADGGDYAMDLSQPDTQQQLAATQRTYTR